MKPKDNIEAKANTIDVPARLSWIGVRVGRRPRKMCMEPKRGGENPPMQLPSRPRLVYGIDGVLLLFRALYTSLSDVMRLWASQNHGCFLTESCCQWPLTRTNRVLETTCYSTTSKPTPFWLSDIHIHFGLRVYLIAAQKVSPREHMTYEVSRWASIFLC